MAGWAEKSMREAIELLARAGRNDLATDLNRIQARVDFDDLDVLRCVGIDRIADAILEANSFSELIALLGKLAKAMGLSHCTLHVISEAASTNFSTKVLTTYPEAWISRYVDRRYFAIDPVGPACFTSDYGFFWDCFDRNVPVARTFWETRPPMASARPATLARSSPSAATGWRSPYRRASTRIRFAIASSATKTISSTSASTSPTASAGWPPTTGPTPSTPPTISSASCAPSPSGVTEDDLRQRSYQFGSYATLERSICMLFRTKTVVQAAILATRIGLLADAPLTKADILAAPDVIAVGRLIVAPTGAPLRRLARLRTPAPEAAESSAA